MVVADLVKDAGEGASGVALEGELAVLAGCALGAGSLEQHAGHAVPVIGPDGVGLHCYVGGCLDGQQEQFILTFFTKINESIEKCAT